MKHIMGMYMSGEYTKSIIFGASRFCSIIFSKPLPIDTTKNNKGAMPISVAQKKFLTFTLKIQGNTFDKAKGIPPINR